VEGAGGTPRPRSLRCRALGCSTRVRRLAAGAKAGGADATGGADAGLGAAAAGASAARPRAGSGASSGSASGAKREPLRVTPPPPLLRVALDAAGRALAPVAGAALAVSREGGSGGPAPEMDGGGRPAHIVRAGARAAADAVAAACLSGRGAAEPARRAGGTAGRSRAEDRRPMRLENQGVECAGTASSGTL
jgi:hypothetical protein